MEEVLCTKRQWWALLYEVYMYLGQCTTKSRGWSLEDLGLNPFSTTSASHLTFMRLNVLSCKMESIHRGLLSAKLCDGIKAPGVVPGPFQVLESTQIGRQEREEQFG